MGGSGEGVRCYRVSSQTPREDVAARLFIHLCLFFLVNMLSNLSMYPQSYGILFFIDGVLFFRLQFISYFD